jgi:hypothetical protein
VWEGHYLGCEGWRAVEEHARTRVRSVDFSVRIRAWGNDEGGRGGTYSAWFSEAFLIKLAERDHYHHIVVSVDEQSRYGKKEETELTACA